MKTFFGLALAVTTVRAYWLMGAKNFITTERIDPIVNPGKVSGHVHSVLGGSNFRFNTNTAALRQSECTSIPIPQDKSAYWFPHLYFQWNNGSFSSLNGGAVILDYLFNDKPGTTTAFPDDFRMISGDPTLRTYDPSSYAQKAISFLCLDFDGKSVVHNELPNVKCPSGIRAQINFPSCWDGKNVDSPDHKSHVAFLSDGPDAGTCSDPKFPVTLPRIFMEVYWDTVTWDKVRDQAQNPNQPFVYAMGDPTGHGYHADFMNGWEPGVLQNAVDKCHCNPYGDPTCCVDQGIFGMDKESHCRITKSIDEQTTGTLSKLPGNNPVQGGAKAQMLPDNTNPGIISPVYAYTGDQPTKTGVVTTPGQLPAVDVAVPPSDASPSSTVGTSSLVAAPSSSLLESGQSTQSPTSIEVFVPAPSDPAATYTSSPINSSDAPPTPQPTPNPDLGSTISPSLSPLPTSRPVPTGSTVPSAPSLPQSGSGNQNPPNATSPGSKTCSKGKRSVLEARSSGLKQHKRARHRRAFIENS